MLKKLVTILSVAWLALATTQHVAAQNIEILSVSFSSGLSTCTSDSVTVEILLGCVNFTYDSIAADTIGGTLNINIYYTGSWQCYGSLTYPSFTVELPPMNYGTYTVVTKSYESFSVSDSYTSSTSVASCDPASEFEMSDSSICLGDSLWLTNNSQSSNFYTWLVNGQVVSNDTNLAYLFTSSGSHVITLIATDGNLIDTSSQTIEVLNAAPSISLGADTAVCPGDSITLDAGSGYGGYLWSTGQTTQTIHRSNGLYRVTVTEVGSCDGHDTVLITKVFLPPMVVQFTSPSNCDEVELGVSAQYAIYVWSTGSNDSNITVQASGTYSITTTSAEGCEQIDSLVVEVLASPENNLGNDTTMCSEESWFLTLNASSAGIYAWQNGATSSYLGVSNAPGVYWLTITADNGCSSTDTILIDEEDCSLGLFNLKTNSPFLYPNPAKTEIHIPGLKEETSITIRNLAGEIIISDKGLGSEFAIDVQVLESGEYIIQGHSASQNFVKTLLIVR
jgi:hypothetical protein